MHYPVIGGERFSTISPILLYITHFRQPIRHGVDALDPTGYYFPGYPKVPADDYIYNLKRTAFVNGVAISGTGVRNDFAVADAAARATAGRIS